VNVNYFLTPRTVRYYSLVNNELPVSRVLFVLHGYGMSARRFLEQFEHVLAPGMMIVAPEGLSRFYRKGHSGEVVASWMTSDDRETEIRDYLEYLDALYQLVTADGQKKSLILGFSQGASTASRWFHSPKCHHKGLILWAGTFAPEKLQKIDSECFVWNVSGNEDEYISLENHHQQTQRLLNLNYSVREVVFNGRHQIDIGVLKSIMDEFNSETK
jgi:predicted esterase